jgi:hypothetical protein
LIYKESIDEKEGLYCVEIEGAFRLNMCCYNQRFKEIGIIENNLIPLTENGIPMAALDLRDYHAEHMFYRHYLNKNTF